MATFYCKQAGKRLHVNRALKLKSKGNKVIFSCIECGNPVKAHSGNKKTKAHFEHYKRNPNCTLSHSDSYKPSKSRNIAAGKNAKLDNNAELELIYQAIAERSTQLQANGPSWARQLGSAKNYVTTPSLFEWTFAKSAKPKGGYFDDGGQAKSWFYARNFQNIMTLNDEKLKLKFVKALNYGRKDEGTDI